MEKYILAKNTPGISMRLVLVLHGLGGSGNIERSQHVVGTKPLTVRRENTSCAPFLRSSSNKSMITYAICTPPNNYSVALITSFVIDFLVSFG